MPRGTKNVARVDRRHHFGLGFLDSKGNVPESPIYTDTIFQLRLFLNDSFFIEDVPDSDYVWFYKGARILGVSVDGQRFLTDPGSVTRTLLQIGPDDLGPISVRLSEDVMKIGGRNRKVNKARKFSISLPPELLEKLDRIRGMFGGNEPESRSGALARLIEKHEEGETKDESG